MVVICNKPYPIKSNYDFQFSLFNFPLSDFQKYAIEAIVDGHHVLVACPTGSGKTLPAEFAINFFMSKRKKLIYTSPIKALSNQKYYEFTQKFPNISVGLMTGDIKINPNADVLIMTTEILMNYLFNTLGNTFKKEFVGEVESQTQLRRETLEATKETNEFVGEVESQTQLRRETLEATKETNEFVGEAKSQTETKEFVGEVESQPLLQFQMDIENELGCVVFDEVHYINDQERGGNWEQTILMLPRHIQMVMLSATIDSPERFAKWCERGDDTEKKVYLAYTNHRIVPLTHYGFMTTNESIFKGLKDKVLEKEIRDSTNKIILLQSAKGEFNEKGFNQILKMNEIFKKKNVFIKRKSVLNNLALYMKNNEMLPAIAFVFSRKNVELCAHEIHTNLLEDDSKIPYIVSRECDQYIRRLSNYNEYVELPEYTTLVSLLEKGIGIHHSGMIPILREIVELFISKKYIKLLFATESFSIGLDCPIKTAIFTGLRKFDGNQDRFLMSHEYTQMAGRAGRRGIDTIGNVIHCNNLFKPPTINEYKIILSGKPQELISKFNISYSVVLNLMKQGAEKYKDFQDFVEKSMIHQEITKEKEIRCKQIMLIQEKIEKKKSMIKHLKIPIEIMSSYYKLEQECKNLNGNKRKGIEKNLNSIKNDYNNFVGEVESQMEVRRETLKMTKETKEFDRDYSIYNELLELNNEYNCYIKDYEYIKNFIHIQILKIIDILKDKKYIKEVTNETLSSPLSTPEFSGSASSLTSPLLQMDELGIIASNINEINGIIMSHFMNKWNFFEEFTILQIIGILSCFTDIKVADEFSINTPTTKDILLKEKIQEIVDYFEVFHSIEKSKDMRTGINYEKPLNFDITDEIIEWCEIKNELECKIFIQTKLKEKEISIGEFTKGILKISVIVKELSIICELLGKVSLLHKLSQVDGMILKYITICQSLYI